ncbi:MAG: ribosome maturation factor RimP [Gammaproteobacteria bacterium]|nr:ribosome maturation factor RimP [Gammaproteobacteria bacterium]
MSGQNKLDAIIEPAVEALGYEHIGSELSQAGKRSCLRVYIDGPHGIGVDDCAKVSRQLSAVLDVEDPIASAYQLEVSSPGLERPLFKPAHYKNTCGQRIKVRLRVPKAGQRNFNGTLKAVTDETITLLLDDQQELELSLTSIAKANRVVEI